MLSKQTINTKPVPDKHISKTFHKKNLQKVQS